MVVKSELIQKQIQDARNTGVWYCNSCFKKLEPDWLYCPFCGYELGAHCDDEGKL
jgi:predicted amidophosphoribosyltransferase